MWPYYRLDFLQLPTELLRSTTIYRARNAFIFELLENRPINYIEDCVSSKIVDVKYCYLSSLCKIWANGYTSVSGDRTNSKARPSLHGKSVSIADQKKKSTCPHAGGDNVAIGSLLRKSWVRLEKATVGRTDTHTYRRFDKTWGCRRWRSSVPIEIEFFQSHKHFVGMTIWTVLQSTRR